MTIPTVKYDDKTTDLTDILKGRQTVLEDHAGGKGANESEGEWVVVNGNRVFVESKNS